MFQLYSTPDKWTEKEIIEGNSAIYDIRYNILLPYISVRKIQGFKESWISNNLQTPLVVSTGLLLVFKNKKQFE